MIKEEFIEKLISRFSYYSEKDSLGSLKDIYKRVLTKQINYEQLWDKFCNEYAGKTPPTGVELKNLARTCYIEKEQKEYKQWLQVEVLDPRTQEIRKIDAFPAGTTLEQMIKTYEKKFNCTGWKILNVY